MSLFEASYEGPYELQEWELTGETAGESYESYETGEMNEALEMELVQELLEITNEAELEEFLGKLVRSVGKAASGFIRSPIGKALGGVLRNVAKTALPMVGSAIGSFVAPGIGTAIGGKLGSMAGGLLEVNELETMGESEAEFEAARRYVQWARGTTRNALRTPRGVDPRTAVRAAAVTSARRYAPALLNANRPSGWRSRRPNRAANVYNLPAADPWAGAGSSDPNDDWAAPSAAPGDGAGRWVRRGSRIILFDV